MLMFHGFVVIWRFNILWQEVFCSLKSILGLKILFCGRVIDWLVRIRSTWELFCRGIYTRGETFWILLDEGLELYGPSSLITRWVFGLVDYKLRVYYKHRCWCMLTKQGMLSGIRVVCWSVFWGWVRFGIGITCEKVWCVIIVDEGLLGGWYVL